MLRVKGCCCIKRDTIFFTVDRNNLYLTSTVSDRGNYINAIYVSVSMKTLFYSSQITSNMPGVKKITYLNINKQGTI